MLIDKEKKELQIKIVYFGPAMSGKTTSIRALSELFGVQVTSIESSIGRTLFFDYFPLDYKNIEFQDDWKLKAHTYSTTGQDFYIVTRPITLQNADGIIFVADSQKIAYERNLISWNELNSYFGDLLIDFPKIIAFNKQDLLDKFNYSIFLEKINYTKYNNIDIEFTTALNGEGIKESFDKLLSFLFKRK